MPAQVKVHLDRAEQSAINGDHEGVISESRQAVQIDSAELRGPRYPGGGIPVEGRLRERSRRMP